MSFEFTPNLYRRMLKIHAWRKYKIFLFILFLSAVAAVAISIYAYFKSGELKVFYAWTPYLVCVALWFIFLIWALPFWMSTHKLNRKQFQEMTISVIADQIIVKLANGFKTEIPMTQFVKFQRTNLCTFLWHDVINVVMIPAEVFPSNESYNEFVDTIASQIEI